MTQESTQLKQLPDTPKKSEVFKIYSNKNVAVLRKYIQDLQKEDSISIQRQYLTKNQFIKVLEMFGVPSGYKPFKELDSYK